MEFPENKIIWTKCYEDSWKDHIVPEAFSHPAKMAYGLLNRIFDHCKAEGWGGVIVDPFGGIGSTGILGAHDGYQVICCELEQKFVNLARKNFCLHLKAWEQFGNPEPQILQGDSRKLCELVESADIIVSSPPFLGGQALDENSKHKEWWNRKKIDCKRDPGTASNTGTCYGTTPSQLGSMKPGKVDLVISSPPYADGCRQVGGQDPKPYYIQSGNKDVLREYGRTKGNLGNLKAGDVDVILSSPPFQKSMVESGDPNYAHKFHGSQKDYGKSAGQLGQEQGPTFWQAAKEILQQCHKILRSGGHAIWVCKDFVRKGERVPFSDDWLRLCESVGFKLTCRHRAMLAKDEIRPGLFNDIRNVKEDKSFFRRLFETKAAWKRYWNETQSEIEKQISIFKSVLDGNIFETRQTIRTRAMRTAFEDSGEHIRDWNDHVRIDWEDVICMEK